MRRVRFLLALAAAMAVLTLPRLARAQWYYAERGDAWSRPHVYLSADAVAVGVLGQTGRDAFLDDGFGVRLALGGRITRWLALEGVWQPTAHNLVVDAFGTPVGRIGLQALTLDAKLYPAWRWRVQPWVGLGFGAHILDAEGWAPIAEGPGWHGDVGVDLWLTRWLTFDAHAGYRGMDLIGSAPRDDTYVSLLEGGLGLAARF